MADEAIRALEVLAPPSDKPLEQLTLGELLTDGARVGLMTLREIAGSPPDMRDGADHKRNRLIMDAGATLVKTLARVQEASMRRTDSEDWRGMVERLAQIEEETKDL